MKPATNMKLTPNDDKENPQPSEKRKHDAAIETQDAQDIQRRKRWKRIAHGRFGRSGLEGDGCGIERFEVRIDDAFPKSVKGELIVANESDQLQDWSEKNQQKVTVKASSKSNRKKRPSMLDKTPSDERDESQVETNTWKPDVRISFQGAHIFAGIRKLVEQGIVDGEKMPGWMTGEAGVSIGVIKHDRMMAKADAAL